jgi:thioredoxin reductase (NADPH)
MSDEARNSGRPSIRPSQSRADEATSQPLAEDQIAILRRVGEVRRVQAGDVLFREGDRGWVFVILSGLAKICDHQAGVERQLSILGARQFTASLGLFTGERSLTTAIVVEPGEVLVVAKPRSR